MISILVALLAAVSLIIGFLFGVDAEHLRSADLLVNSISDEAHRRRQFTTGTRV